MTFYDGVCENCGSGRTSAMVYLNNDPSTPNVQNTAEHWNLDQSGTSRGRISLCGHFAFGDGPILDRVLGPIYW